MDLVDVDGVHGAVRVLRTLNRAAWAEMREMAIVVAANAMGEVVLAWLWEMPLVTVVADHEVLERLVEYLHGLGAEDDLMAEVVADCASEKVSIHLPESRHSSTDDTHSTRSLWHGRG